MGRVLFVLVFVHFEKSRSFVRHFVLVSRVGHSRVRIERICFLSGLCLVDEQIAVLLKINCVSGCSCGSTLVHDACEVTYGSKIVLSTDRIVKETDELSVAIGRFSKLIVNANLVLEGHDELFLRTFPVDSVESDGSQPGGDAGEHNVRSHRCVKFLHDFIPDHASVFIVLVLTNDILSLRNE